MLTTGSCDRHGAAWEKLEIAENLMDSKPDSALAVLEGIPASKVKGKEISARYALLKSMALDKNCIDTTTFDILQPAIDYLLHCSRHTFATLQLEHDTDIYTIKGMLGHTNVKTTQIYAHIVDKSKRNAADAIHIDGLNKANAVSESA